MAAISNSPVSSKLSSPGSVPSTSSIPKTSANDIREAATEVVRTGAKKTGLLGKIAGIMPEGMRRAAFLKVADYMLPEDILDATRAQFKRITGKQFMQRVVEMGYDALDPAKQTEMVQGAVELMRAGASRPAVLRFCAAGYFRTAVVKCLQAITSRPELVPNQEYRDELGKVVDACRVEDFGYVAQLSKKATGAELREVYDKVETEPLAAGSLAQAHVGWLPDGERVVLKAIKPEADFLAADYRALLDVLIKEEPGAMPLQRILGEIMRHADGEIDLRRERQVMERVRALYGERFSPEPIADLSSKKLLVMGWVGGTKVERTPDPLASQRQVFADWVLMLSKGLFHADPSPGNVRVDKDGQVRWLDWGIYGDIAPEQGMNVLKWLHGMATGNATSTAEALTALCTTPPAAAALAKVAGEPSVENGTYMALQTLPLSDAAVLAAKSYGQILGEAIKLAERAGQDLTLETFVAEVVGPYFDK